MKYGLLLSLIIVSILMLWITQMPNVKENFEQNIDFCPDNRFKNFRKEGCKIPTNVNTCRKTSKPGYIPNSKICDGILPKEFCPDIDYYEFDFNGCTQTKNRTECEGSTNPKYVANFNKMCKNKVPKGFCPDPKYNEFLADGCRNKTSLDTCLESVNDGYIPKEGLCRLKKPIPFCADDKYIEYEDIKVDACKGDEVCMKVCGDKTTVDKCNEFININKCNGDRNCIFACNRGDLTECKYLQDNNKHRQSGGYIAKTDDNVCKNLKSKVCTDPNKQNFKPNVCSVHEVPKCKETLNKQYRYPDSDIEHDRICGSKITAKEFCPDPNYKEFEYKENENSLSEIGCYIPTGLSTCEETVKIGFLPNRNKCKTLKQSEYQFMDNSDRVKIPPIQNLTPLTAPDVVPSPANERPQWANVHA